MRCSVALLALLTSQAWAACEQNPDGTWPSTCASLTWTAPTQNVDGTPLTNLAGYRIYRDCGSGQSLAADVAAPTQAWADEAPPIPATCSYRATAYNTLNEESAQTNPVSKTFSLAAELPGPVTSTFTWQIEEPPDVALAFTLLEASRDASTLAGTSDSTSTGSITCPADSVTYVALAVAVNSNGTVSFSVSGASLTWDQVDIEYYASRRTVAVFRGVNTGAETSGALTVSMTSSGNALQELAWSIVRVTGADTADPEGTPISNSVSSGTAMTIADFGGPPSGDDQVFAASAFESGADSFAFASGMTEIGSVTGGANVRSLKTAYGTDQTPGVTWGTSGNGAGGIAFIVNAAAGGGAAASLSPINPAARMAAMIVH